MIALMVMIPIISSDALAATVQIESSAGEAGIEGFLDGRGDNWRLVVGISGAEDVRAEDLEVRIGQHTAPFTSCQSGEFGQVCEYLSAMSEGINEGSFTFEILHLGEVQNSEIINIDGSSPKISAGPFSQQRDRLVLNFAVDDDHTDGPSVGLAKVEIFDADSGELLQQIDAQGKIEYSYAGDGEHRVEDLGLAGEGFRRLKIFAEDLLGHRVDRGAIVGARLDLVPPTIHSETLAVGIGRFIGDVVVNTNMSVEVSDTNFDEAKTVLESEDVVFESAAKCDPHPLIENRYRCGWDKVVIAPKESFTFSMKVQDTFGNEASAVLSKGGFAKDSVGPVIEYFGTSRVFEGRNFVATGSISDGNLLILRVRDNGAGIDSDGVRADLSEVGGSSSAIGACFEQGEVLECRWQVRLGTKDVATVGLSRLQDKVGNVGERARVELFQDKVAPIVERVAFYGVSDGRDKDYVQSGDTLRVELNIVEATGVEILVGVGGTSKSASAGIVLDAYKTFAYGDVNEFGNYIEHDDDGKMRFSEVDCDRSEGRYICSVEVPGVRSGYVSNVPVPLIVRDSGGNVATVWPVGTDVINVQSGSRGVYDIDILGLRDEPDPNYWQVATRAGVVPQLDFIDLDTTEHVYTRMPLAVTFETDLSRVAMLSMELAGCTPVDEDAPQISRALLHGRVVPGEGTERVGTNIIVEFEPFDAADLTASETGSFKTRDVAYTCEFRLFSQVEDSAIRAPELQEVEILVPFGFSSLGAIDENLAKKIKDFRGSDWRGFLDAMSYVDTAFVWLKYITDILSIISSVSQFVTVFTASLGGAGAKARDTAVGAGIGAALQGGCFSAAVSETSTWKIVDYIQIPAQILRCSPVDHDSTGIQDYWAGNTWYGKWQRNVLDAYNTVTLRDFAGQEASSLYDNMWLSLIGLCVPGIVHNLEKWRQIQCRREICYGREVPDGVATVELCDSLYDLQICEYFAGPAVEMIPGLKITAIIAGALKDIAGNPVGLFVTVVEYGLCSPLCFTAAPEASLTACRVGTGFSRLVGIIDSIVGVIDNVPTKVGNPYCKTAEKIDLDELSGGNKVIDEPAQEEVVESAVAG